MGIRVKAGLGSLVEVGIRVKSEVAIRAKDKVGINVKAGGYKCRPSVIQVTITPLRHCSWGNPD